MNAIFVSKNGVTVKVLFAMFVNVAMVQAQLPAGYTASQHLPQGNVLAEQETVVEYNGSPTTTINEIDAIVSEVLRMREEQAANNEVQYDDDDDDNDLSTATNVEVVTIAPHNLDVAVDEEGNTDVAQITDKLSIKDAIETTSKNISYYEQKMAEFDREYERLEKELAKAKASSEECQNQIMRNKRLQDILNEAVELLG